MYLKVFYTTLYTTKYLYLIFKYIYSFLFIQNGLKYFFGDHEDDRLNEVPDHHEIESQEESQSSACLCHEGRGWVDVDLLGH